MSARTEAPALYGFGQILQSALSYTVGVGGTSSAVMVNKPNRLCLVANLTAFSAGGQTMTIAVQTSPDGSTWVDTGISITGIAATGEQVLRVDKPIMKYVRLYFDESGSGPTATIDTYLYADADPFTLGNFDEESNPAAPDFAYCNNVLAVHAAQAVASTDRDSTNVTVDGSVEQGFVVWTISGRTAGTLAPKLQHSYDAGTTWLDVPGTSISASSIASGKLIAGITGPCSELVAAHYTVASSWDGSVAMDLYTDNPVFAAA